MIILNSGTTTLSEDLYIVLCWSKADKKFLMTITKDIVGATLTESTIGDIIFDIEEI